MVKVKICGITSPKDALFAVQSGADYIGIITYPKSPRFVPKERRKEILRELEKTGVKKVAVVVNEPLHFLEELLEEGFDLIQLHGDEPPSVGEALGFERVIKVFRVKEELPRPEGWEEAHGILLDTYSEKLYGGTGRTFNWEVAKRLVDEGWRVFLSGGLKPENVSEAVRRVKPFCVDVSSGVELRKGVKDPERVRSFISLAKGIPERAS
ncbi:MAG: phosphoribosylanthranilate isomerase [Aquificae bacterium]|nr:phosphoribosylanthranilate isomerase [Aquificota bacterium]